MAGILCYCCFGKFRKIYTKATVIEVFCKMFSNRYPTFFLPKLGAFCEMDDPKSVNRLDTTILCRKINTNLILV